MGHGVHAGVSHDVHSGENSGGQQIASDVAFLIKGAKNQSSVQCFLRYRHQQYSTNGHDPEMIVNHGRDAAIIQIGKVEEQPAVHQGNDPAAQPVAAGTQQYRQQKIAHMLANIGQRPLEKAMEDPENAKEIYREKQKVHPRTVQGNGKISVE